MAQPFRFQGYSHLEPGVILTWSPEGRILLWEEEKGLIQKELEHSAGPIRRFFDAKKKQSFLTLHQHHLILWQKEELTYNPLNLNLPEDHLISIKEGLGDDSLLFLFESNAVYSMDFHDYHFEPQFHLDKNLRISDFQLSSNEGAFFFFEEKGLIIKTNLQGMVQTTISTYPKGTKYLPEKSNMAISPQGTIHLNSPDWSQTRLISSLYQNPLPGKNFDFSPLVLDQNSKIYPLGSMDRERPKALAALAHGDVLEFSLSENRLSIYYLDSKENIWFFPLHNPRALRALGSLQPPPKIADFFQWRKQGKEYRFFPEKGLLVSYGAENPLEQSFSVPQAADLSAVHGQPQGIVLGYQRGDLWYSDGNRLRPLGAFAQQKVSTLGLENRFWAAGGEKGQLLWGNLSNPSSFFRAQLDGSISALDLFPEKSLFAAGTDKGEIALYSLVDGSLLRRWKAHPLRIFHLSFDPLGLWLASSSYEGIGIWQVTTAKNWAFMFNQNKIMEIIGFINENQLVTKDSENLILWDWKREDLKSSIPLDPRNNDPLILRDNQILLFTSQGPESILWE